MMNRKKLRGVCCLLLALAMTAAMSACGGKTPPVNSSGADVSTGSSESTASGATESGGVESAGGTTETGNKENPLEPGEKPNKTTSGKTEATTAPTGNSGEKTSLTRDQVMAKMPKKLKGTTLKYFSWADPKVLVEKDAIAAFEKATGITVKTELGSLQEYEAQLAARIAADNAPDLVRLHANNMGIENFQPITNSGFDFNDTAWDDWLMKDFTFNGRTYATNLKNSALPDVAVFYYNKKAIQKAEMEDPYQIWKKNPSAWTWDKFWSMCKTFLQRNGNRNGYYGAIFEYENAYLRAFGVRNWDYDTKQGKWVNTIKEPELAKRWEILLDAYQKKLASPVCDDQAFKLGRVLFCWSNPYNLRVGNTYYAELKKDNNLGVVPLPTDSTKQTLYQYSAHGIPVGAKNKEAVPYFLRYILDRQSYDMNKMYINPQAQDVVEWSVKQGLEKNNFFFGSNSSYDITQALLAGTPAQAKTILDSYSGKIDDIVDEMNEKMKNLPK